MHKCCTAREERRTVSMFRSDEPESRTHLLWMKNRSLTTPQSKLHSQKLRGIKNCIIHSARATEEENFERFVGVSIIFEMGEIPRIFPRTSDTRKENLSRKNASMSHVKWKILLTKNNNSIALCGGRNASNFHVIEKVKIYFHCCDFW